MMSGDEDDRWTVRSAEVLESLYGPVAERSLLKQRDRLDEHAQAFIAASPFVLLATRGEAGADCSPRGDAPGFVRVADEKTLLLPDRRGNNRIDSLRNVVHDPAVALLFLVPGVSETFRINGRARISADPALLESFAVDGKLPTTVLVVTVDEVFVQCSRALVRSELWNPARHVPRSALPSMGAILAACTAAAPDPVNASEYDEELAARVAASLY
jgi:PPOX class probable FMN-dependent enzyme